MNIKSSICGIQHTCINFLIFLIGIITKIECWPVFKQDPTVLAVGILSHSKQTNHTQKNNKRTATPKRTTKEQQHPKEQPSVAQDGQCSSGAKTTLDDFPQRRGPKYLWGSTDTSSLIRVKRAIIIFIFYSCSLVKFSAHKSHFNK